MTIPQRAGISAIPKEMKKSALISALSKKFRENNILVMDEMRLANGKTKALAGIVKKLGLDKKSTLLVVGGENKNVLQAGRNIKKLSIKKINEFNAYHVLRNTMLLFDKETVQAIEKRMGQGKVNG